MKNQEVKTKVHFTDNALINPTNPITVNLIELVEQVRRF